MHIHKNEYKMRARMRCMDSITVKIARCRNCGTVQWPRLDADAMSLVWPKSCKNNKCRSPYWNKPRVR